MGKDTKIAWAHHTINPWQGCSKVNKDCKNCYMFRGLARWNKDGGVVVKTKGRGWVKIIKDALPGERIFVCSMSDFWHKAADDWRKEVFDLMRARPDVNFLIPTKRPDRIEANLPADWGDNGWPHVWLGWSAGHQAAYDSGYEIMCYIPNAVLWVSAEPLLEDIQINRTSVHGTIVNPLLGDKFRRKLDWVVTGGESGNDTGPHKYRECKTKWLMRIADQCKENSVPVFVKQMGTHLYKVLKMSDRAGANIEEFPEGLQYQEFPETVTA